MSVRSHIHDVHVHVAVAAEIKRSVAYAINVVMFAFARLVSTTFFRFSPSFFSGATNDAITSWLDALFNSTVFASVSRCLDHLPRMIQYSPSGRKCAVVILQGLRI